MRWTRPQRGMEPRSLAAEPVWRGGGRNRARSPGANRIAFAPLTEDSHRRRLGALGAAVALAEAAVVALRPRHGVIAAHPVEALAHFDEDDIAPARRYGRGQPALAGAGAAAATARLIWLVRRNRGAQPAAPVSAEGHPVAGMRSNGGEQASLALVGGRGAALSLALVLAPLPFGALMRKRALSAGL